VTKCNKNQDAYFNAHLAGRSDVADGRVVWVRVHEPHADRDVVGASLVADRNGSGQVDEFSARTVVEHVRLEVGLEPLVLFHDVAHVDAGGIVVPVLGLGQELLDLGRLPHCVRTLVFVGHQLNGSSMVHARGVVWWSTAEHKSISQESGKGFYDCKQRSVTSGRGWREN
jgi:hypothetical protein